MDVHKIDWSAIPWTPVRQGVEREQKRVRC